MIELYELQYFSGHDARELLGKMFMIDKFKINQQKFNNSLKFMYYHILIIFPNMAYKMLIERS